MNYLIYICRRSHVNLRDHKTIINTFIHHQSNQPPSHLITVIYFTQYIYLHIPDTKAIVNIVTMIGIFSLIEWSVPFQPRLFQGATQSPETARQRQVPPTHQPSRSPAKERASQPNSVIDYFSKLPSRRRQVIITFYVGSTVERSILDRASVESPCLCVFAFFLLYCRTITVHTRGGFVGWWIDFPALLCCTAVRWYTHREWWGDTCSSAVAAMQHQ